MEESYKDSNNNMMVEFNMMVNCYDRMIAIIKKILPKDEKLVGSFYASKKMVKGLGMGYEKIDACHNGCMLFYKEDQLKSSCSVCCVSQSKRIGNKKTYHTRFFDTFSSLLDFRGFTCPRVLSDK